ncbi:hypothetical protein JL722_6797 [Aureococcus anophagefferens]|nr:hypothetical protein JL722_6797 [Aureococcus anophagefferens]
MRRCPLIALVLAPAVARFHGCPLVALVLAPAVARFQGGEVDSGAVEPWVRDLAELCPPGADAPCNFRERPGCRDGLRGRYGLPERAFADRALPISTPENARLFPPRFDARGRLERFAVVNATLLRYRLIRKSGSRLMLDIVRARGRGARPAATRRPRRATRVVDFTFVAEPFSRLLSGYHEIDGARCPSSARGPGWHCGRAYKLEAPGSRARFEAFVREVLPEDFDPARLDDAISYHVASQASAVSPYRRFDFVGRLETLRASVLSLLSLAVDDPERYASRLAGLLDYRCFGYDAAYLEGGVRASRCSEVRW